ncbi:MAG: YIP1 family protein [Verrucomicrobiota bacterium]|nr:YIP1 family protein [Verrucomicrobiota bacterium]
MAKTPWLTVWTHPRETVAAIAAKNPKQELWWLSAIYGFSSVLNSFQSLLIGQHVHIFLIFLLAAALSPLWGYVSISVWSWIVALTGKWLKGAGDFQTVRCAYAWSCVPLLINIPLWSILFVLFGSSLFTNFTEPQLLTQIQVTCLFLILLARVVAVIWSLVIYINALAAVQQFSILRAIGNILSAGALVFAVFYLFFYLFNLIVQPMPQPTSLLIDLNLSQTLRYL